MKKISKTNYFTICIFVFSVLLLFLLHELIIQQHYFYDANNGHIKLEKILWGLCYSSKIESTAYSELLSSHGIAKLSEDWVLAIRQEYGAYFNYDTGKIRFYMVTA